MKIKTMKLKTLLSNMPSYTVDRVRAFMVGPSKQKYNYITVNSNTGFPISRHVQWEKARDRVLKERPGMQLVIVDCTGT